MRNKKAGDFWPSCLLFQGFFKQWVSQKNFIALSQFLKMDDKLYQQKQKKCNGHRTQNHD
jgi:hypothetical protein